MSLPPAPPPQPQTASETAPTPSAPVSPLTPAWAEGASPLYAAVRGLGIAATVPGVILFATSFGYGTFAREMGFAYGHTIFLTAVLYALPAQVVLVDQLVRGASVWAAGFAVMLTAIRLLPMTVNLVPLLRGAPGSRRWPEVPIVHFVAVTSWVEGLRRLPHLPLHLRLAHFCGIGIGMLSMTLGGTTSGYLTAGSMPPLLAAAMLFATPLYFLCSMLVAGRSRPDVVAVMIGCLIGPPLFLAVPGFDLMLSGLIGGTIAFWVGQRQRASGATK